MQGLSVSLPRLTGSTMYSAHTAYMPLLLPPMPRLWKTWPLRGARAGAG